ncbi:MAG: phosphatidylserine/phosphatidylglycerophosphate/cardiolipin synthase family protein [Chloroflexota bacterium]
MTDTTQVTGNINEGGATASSDTIETVFLCAGCQTDIDIATKIAAYLKQARKSIDISAYSFSLCPDTRDIILAVLRERATAGVQIRIAYDAGTQQSLMTVHNDPCDFTTAQFVQSLGFPCKPIEGDRALMHHKYIILDGGTPQAQVWTGSMNFTDDSWQLQENNVIIFQSGELAKYYLQDFDELWVDSHILSSGIMDSGEATLQYGGKPAYVLVNFSPSEGEWIDESIANLIDRTKEQISIASVVITSTRIIKALLGAMERGVPIEGIYDWSQMEGVKYQWQLVPMNTWKIGAFARIVEYGKLVGKRSTPYTPTSTHDYMHNKVMVLDNAVLTGSYNFSRHAQKNAENALVIQSEALAQSYRDYVRKITSMYEAASPTFTRKPITPEEAPEAPEIAR